MWFPNRSDTNRPKQAQKRARSLKFWSLVEEELFYPRSEIKGADQLRGYHEADLRLCFRLCRLLVFPCGGSHFVILHLVSTFVLTFVLENDLIFSIFELCSFSASSGKQQQIFYL